MSFSSKVDKFAEDSLKAAGDIKKQVVLELFSSVVMDTPVDTGRARGNWQASLNGPKEGELNREDKAGSAVMTEIKSTLGTLESTNYLTNNLPYIQALEYGSSTQAPNGMVRRNVSRIAQNIRKAVRENKI